MMFKMTQSKKSKKSKKSTTKKRVFGVSPLIPAIALIEVIVLIVVSSYAWFYVQASKVIGSGTISVAADSGLDIDFQYSNVDDYINIWNYVGSDFTFEPGTSLDGRTIYFPTSGTFDNNTTSGTVFRDGTVNDINAKYLSIDFELTNTSDYDQYVYLNNNSYFHVQDKNSEAYEESRALRLAFYQNDGNSGNVGSSLLSSENGSSDGAEDTEVNDEEYHTFYFDTVGNSSWSRVYAYFFKSDPGEGESEYYQAWPGLEMSNKNGKIYTLSVKKTELNDYDKVIFTNGYSGWNNQTSDRDITDCIGKAAKMESNPTYSTLYWQTIYFIKPYAWGTPYCKTYCSDSGVDNSYSNEPMTYVGSGIYSYTYYYQFSTDDGVTLSDNIKRLHFHNGQDGWNTSETQYQQTGIITVSGTNNRLYYSDGSTDGSYDLSCYSTGETPTPVLYSSLSYNTVYFFNTYGWDMPYATVTTDTGVTPNTCDLPMVSLSGNVYYCNVPECYHYVYFRAKNLINDTYRTKQDSIVAQRVYRPVDDMVLDSEHYYHDLKTFSYAKYIQNTGYPVISPGVSAGFQRPYAPVITIDAYSGDATEIVPAYSYSIDNYILGSGTPLFVLKSNHMASLSMIMWLEGTDEACTGAAYAGKQIDLRLEFSTLYYTADPTTGATTVENIVNPGDSASYTYKFFDKTREVWTANRQSTESGVTVAPVMQLYDNTTKRGYRMTPDGITTYDGVQKINAWKVTAPQSIAVLGHDLEFRRVNPYNEEEVWNYWHAGRVAGADDDPAYYDKSAAGDTRYSVYDIAMAGGDGSTVMFTAFSDGSPTESNLRAAKQNEHDNQTIVDQDDDEYIDAANVPEHSCGGLWGNHNVVPLTVLDGTDGHYFQNNNGIMTMQYSYCYSSGTTKRVATIEYKASGPDYQALYNFVVPDGLYSSTRQSAVTAAGGDGDVYFKRYYNFNGSYAINSDLNNRILYENTWNAGMPTGTYFEIAHTYNVSIPEGETEAVGTYLFNAFWGSDILYVQTTPTTHSSLFSDTSKDRKLRAYFYNTAEGNTDDFTVDLFPNTEFKGTGECMGFPVVIPNDHAYNEYYVQFTKNNNDLIYKADPKTLYTTSPSGSTTVSIRNTAYSGTASEHIYRLDHFKDITIYFETKYGGFNGGNWANKRIHFYNIYNDNKKYQWPGAYFTGYENPYTNDQSVVRYSYTVNINDYNTFIVNNGGDSIKFNAYTITPADQNKVFFGHAPGDTTPYPAVTENGRVTVEGVDNKLVITTDVSAAESWPHYTERAAVAATETP